MPPPAPPPSEERMEASSSQITLLGTSHCQLIDSASSRRLRHTTLTSTHNTTYTATPTHTTSTFSSPRRWSRNLLSSSSTLLLLAFLTLTSLALIATGVSGHEAKKEWSNGGHHASSTKSKLGRPRYRSLFACEGSNLEIGCEEGTHINLIRANFGRFSISVCNDHGNVDWSVDCMSHRSFKVIEERCGGRSQCNVEASVSTFGEDSCPRVHKYLEVHFNCTEPGFKPTAHAQSGAGEPGSGGAVHPTGSSGSASSSSDNHHHSGPHHDLSASSSPAPVLNLFPEPLSPSGGHHGKHAHHTTSTSLPFVDVDFTNQDQKEKEETDLQASPLPNEPKPSVFYDRPNLNIPPPRPEPSYPSLDSKLPADEDPEESDSDSDDGSEDDGEDDEAPLNKEPEQNPYNPYGAPKDTEQQPGRPAFYPPKPINVESPSPVPTARPPKPDFKLPSDSQSPPFSASPSVHQNSAGGYPGNALDHFDGEIETATVEIRPPPIDLLYEHCHPMYAKGLNWNWTLAGQVAMQPCPDGAEGMARWSCLSGEGGHPTWRPHLPDMSNCSSLWVTHLVTRIRTHHESMFTLAEELAKGAKGKKMYSGDLIRAADIVKQLVSRLETHLEESKEDQERRATVIKELLNSVLNVASNLLEEIQLESWHELNAQDQRLSIGSLTSALESVAQMLADVRSQPNYNYVRTHNNILVSVHVHSLSALENGLRLPLVLNQHESSSMTDSAPHEVAAYLPYEALLEHANDAGQVKVVFLMYRRLASLLKPRHPSTAYEINSPPSHLTPYAYQHNTVQSADSPYESFLSHQRGSRESARPHLAHEPVPTLPVSTIVNSDVVGLIIASDAHRSSYDRLSTPLSAPLELTLRHLAVDNVTNGRCAFWDIKKSDWSTAGCETVSSNRTHTVCRCNHLTNFAVLMDISNVPMDPSDEFALRLITRIGCAISIVCLALTLLTLSVYRSLKSTRNSIHKHLCACLLTAELIFLLGIDETRVKLICGLIAIALHYFFLSAFLWMFFEGLQLYTMLVQVYGEHRPSRLTFYTLFAYGAPALLVIIAALVDPLSYGTSTHCWLRADNHFVWSFLGPALAVLLANALFLTIAMSVMCRHSPGGTAGTGNGMIPGSTAFAVHQKAVQQAALKVYPSPLTSSPSYSIAEHARLTSIRVWVRTSFALVIVLGLTWTFGVLYLSRSTVIFAYIFTLLNSLQGLFIFIFCCLLNEGVRAEYRTSLARGARRCFLLRPFEPSSLSAFATKSSTDSTRSTSIRDSHHLMMGGATHSPHHLSQQHLYMQQPAASYLGSRATGGPRTSLLYLNELLGKQGSGSEPATASGTPTADQPLITSAMMQQAPLHSQHTAQSSLSTAHSALGLDGTHNLNPLQQTQLSAALAGLSQIQLPDDASSSDYGCRRLTQMIEHIYECIDEDPYVAKLLLPAIERSLTNHQVRSQLASRVAGHAHAQQQPQTQGQTQQHQTMDHHRQQTQLPASILATLGRASHRQDMRLQTNSSYLTSTGPSPGHHHTLHGAMSSMHLPAIVRDNTANCGPGKVLPNGLSGGALNGALNGYNQHHTQQTVAMLDGDQVRCCTLSDHKLCDHQMEGHQQNGGPTAAHAHHMLKMTNGRHHLASEC